MKESIWRRQLSRLEYLPDEIFLEIFKYIPLHDLYHGFHNLNYRIDHVLRSLNELSLTLNKPDDINDQVVSFFASRISHLVVRFSKKVSFARFPSLRSLTSLFPHDEQLTCIRPVDLPHLKRLTLGFMAVSKERIILDLCDRLFSNAFPNLLSCSLWPPAFRTDHSTTRNSSITHVQLKEANFDDLCAVLDSCPQLKHLRVWLNDVTQLHWFGRCQTLEKLDSHLDPSRSISQSTSQTCSSSVPRTAWCVVYALRWSLARETCSTTCTGTTGQTING